MGLPLFVAPVESDLPSKSDKCSSTSPLRSGIRRHGRPDPRDRRAALRRHMSIRDRLANNSLRQASSLSGRTSDQFSILNEPSTTDSLRRPRPFREVLREVVRNNGGTQERFEEHFQSLFGGAPVSDREGRDSSIDEPTASVSIWGPDPVPSSFPQRNRPPPAPYPWASQIPQERPEGLPPFAHERYGLFLPARPTRNSSEADASRRRPTETPSHLFTSTFPNLESVRNVALERIRESSGLGDRERSLSPEVWDTLLTTLTPDPQGPSAGSSFASTVASQSAGASSGTALTTPDGVEGEGVDQACESGCENSDSEAPNYAPRFLRNTRRRLSRRRVRVRDPIFLGAMIDEPVVDGPVERHMDTPTDSHLERLRALTAWGSERRTTSEARRAMEESSNNALGHGNLSLAQFRRPRHGWIGQLSVGTSDEDQGADRRTLNRENSGEEDLDGMRHIVRSLARREDIPDEWWAEAGLSRTIP